MAKTYSFGNFQSMQEDAIKRVLEMQRQSKLVAESNTKDDLNIKTREEIQEEPKETFKPQLVHSQKGCSKPMSFSKEQGDEISEQALLIALLILLINEKSDTALILALIYILF